MLVMLLPIVALPLYFMKTRWLGAIYYLAFAFFSGFVVYSLSASAEVAAVKSLSVFSAVFVVIAAATLLQKRSLASRYLRSYVRFLSYNYVILLVGLFLTKYPNQVEPVFTAILAIVIIIGLISTFRSMLTMGYKGPRSTTSLPSVSVLIPARDETGDLIACLESVTDSDYQKLEILVVDDCSTNPKTPQIIKDFANKGVRFIEGLSPDDNWVGKNFAYQRLYEEASGDLLLFMGVDIRLGRNSIKQLVGQMMAKNRTMVSVMPIRDQLASFALTAPLRYMIETSTPKWLIGRKSSLSSLWMIKPEALKPFGGFKGVSRSIIPERHIAKSVGKNYSFWSARSCRLNIASAKSLASQYEMANRQRYAQLHRRIEYAMLAVLVGGLLLAWPLLIWQPWLMVLSFGGLGIMFALPAYYTYGLAGFMLVGLAPILVAQEIVLILRSLLAYEFGQVNWKGRNVCLPVMRMQVIDHLPKF